MEKEEIIRKARVRAMTIRLGAANERPQLSHGIYGMVMIPTWELRKKSGGCAYAMDKYARIYYDPEVLLGLAPAQEGREVESVKTAIASVLHEVWHYLRRHPERMEALAVRGLRLIPVKANIAMDAEINCSDPYLREHLPPGCIWPATLKDKDTGQPLPEHMVFEWYYERMKWEDDSSGDQPGDSESSEPQVSGNEQETQPAQSGSESAEEGQESSESGQLPQDSPGGESSAGEAQAPMVGDLPGTTEQRSWELGPPTEDGEVPGIAVEDSDRIRDSVAEAIRSSAASGVDRGSLPANWKVWADEQLAAPKIPWQSQLQALARQVKERSLGSSSYTYSRRSRRQSAAPGNVILPAVFHPRLDLAVVFDTSGSMGTQDQTDSLSEAAGILRAVGSDVQVFAGDVHARFAKAVRNVSAIELIGGGGTDMRPLLKAASDTRPHGVVIFTDGYTPWPQEGEMKAPVIVCLVGRHCGESRVPSWMKTIDLEEK